MSKKVNIIGAGLAGLSTGIFLQKEGIETTIFELSPWAGGMCTAWFRKGYRFDGCIHWMVGTKKGEQIYNLYKEVGALADDTDIYNAEDIQLEKNGVMYCIPMELDKFRGYLISLSEQDTEFINGFCDEIDVMMHAKLILGTPSGIAEVVSMLKNSRGFLSIARKYMSKTVGEIVSGLKSDIIREVLTALMPGEYSAISLFMMLGTRMGANAGYPMGGASDVIKRMEGKYKSLGGKINFNTKVDEIVVENGQAKGVRSKDTIYPSDGVVAACDAYDTLEKMLRGRYRHPQLTDMLRDAPLFDPLALVSFGLDKRFGIPFSVTCECPEGVEVAPEVKRYAYNLRSFEFDRTAAPPEGSSVMVMVDSPLEYWARLRSENPDAYKIQKERLAEVFLSDIEKRYPGFKDAVVVVDIATPATYVKLTNVYKGSFEGFAPTPSALKANIKKKIPGLKHFCICGQWTTAGGGICTAVADGRTAAKIIKKEIRK
jgi:phytoene desaturase